MNELIRFGVTMSKVTGLMIISLEPMDRLPSNSGHVGILLSQ